MRQQQRRQNALTTEETECVSNTRDRMRQQQRRQMASATQETECVNDSMFQRQNVSPTDCVNDRMRQRHKRQNASTTQETECVNNTRGRMCQNPRQTPASQALT
jgi:hypothetical protein